jgi:site-specific DNA-cytosine methylase
LPGRDSAGRKAGQDVAGTLGGGSGGRGWCDDTDRSTFVAKTLTIAQRGVPGTTENMIFNPQAGCKQTTLGSLIGSQTPAIAAPRMVRRLTPLECERCQGFPDHWTRFDADGKEISDARRYQMIGNAVVPAVAEWIGRRLMAI